MAAELIPQGEGEVISKRLVIKLGREEIVVCELNRAQGEPGTSPHIHKEHSDCFYVLEGDLQVGLGEETHTVGPGSFVAVPPGVVHWFAKETPGRAHFLNLHAPGCAFDDYLRASRDGDEEGVARFDAHDPPADGGRDPADATVVAAGEGETLAVGESSVVFKTSGDGPLSLMETTVAPGFPGPLPHTHRTFVDSFYILEGELTVRLGNDTVTARPGAYAFAPPETVHTFSNPGDAPVRMLNIMAPAPGPDEMARIAASASSSPASPAP